uniref:Uncharacterized protein n=1 Tax=Mesocestoides corti TaxID=53468 RepID=A0A5K3F2M0_MESCO
MALHQQRQAKCREVRAASLAQQLNQHIKSPSSTRMADNIREFYRTPTMLAEDEPLFSADQPNQEKLEEGGGGDIWGAASLDDPSTTSYDVNSLADDSGAQESQLRPTTNEAFADGYHFDQHTSLWIPSEEDRRTPTLPWTSSLDADTLVDTGPSTSTNRRRKSTKTTPAPPPPPTKRIQARRSSSGSSTSSLT